MDDLNNGVIGTFDDLGTFEDLNNLGDKFDEGGITGVEDTTVVDQEDSFENVNLDGTTEGIDQKDSCQDVSLEGVIVSEDAIVDITLEWTIDYMLCDQEVDILDVTPYLVRVQKDSVAEGLIRN